MPAIRIAGTFHFRKHITQRNQVKGFSTEIITENCFVNFCGVNTNKLEKNRNKQTGKQLYFLWVLFQIFCRPVKVK